jgi:hypothetical protein
MKSQFSLTRVAAIALTAIGLSLSAMADTTTTNNLPAQQKGIQLINQVSDVARDIRYDAEHLDSFDRGVRLSAWSHDYHLNQIKTLVNDGLNPAIVQLQDMQSQFPAWQQQAIDKMLKSANALAADANSAILQRNQSGSTPLARNAEYKAFVKQVYQHAEDLVGSSSAAAAYASAHMKAQAAGIAVPPHS